MTSMVVNVPEIVSEILRHADPNALFAAAQVNHLWAEEATNWIWQSSYRESQNIGERLAVMKMLARLSQRRRDWYTRKIRYLSLAESNRTKHRQPPGGLFTMMKRINFKFPGLKSAILNPSSFTGDENLVQFLQPNLTSLEIHRGCHSSWFLEQIKTEAPRLKAFSYTGDWRPPHVDEAWTADTLLGFLKDKPSITHLHLLPRWWEASWSNSVVEYLFGRPGLEVLQLARPLVVQLEAIKAFQRETPGLRIFSSLRCLETKISYPAFQILLPMLTHLEQIYIQIEAKHGDPLVLDDTISLFTRAKQIIISCPGEVHVTSSTVLLLASRCPLVRNLQLVVRELLDPGVTDEFVEALSSNLIHLERLMLPFQASNLSHESFLSFARHCPHLTHLTLDGNIDIKHLQRLDAAPPELLLPRLRHFGVSISVSFPSPYPSQESLIDTGKTILRILYRRFPSLSYCSGDMIVFANGHVDDVRTAKLTDYVREHVRKKSSSDYENSTDRLFMYQREVDELIGCSPVPEN
ncbi:hypothetical protein FQN52_000679 [Onygenales sp. PD_12]|nr:hypothetical protein FQN52_000679 [Onygenales sp. PD_12]